MLKRKLRIVYMGTPDFAVYPLKRMLEEGYEIVGVITNPDKPAGRGKKIQKSAVKQFALQQGLNILQPEKFKNPEFLQQLADLKADLQIVVAFKMLPEQVWNMPPLGTINLHASLLPDYRGAAPINWAIINGEKETGISTFLLNHEIDTGKIIFQQKVEIREEMTAGELHDKLMEQGAEVLLKTIEAIDKNDYPQIKQENLLKGRDPLLAPKIFKEDMRIDWKKDIKTIYNHIRGLSPFPAAWTELINKETGEKTTLKIYKTQKECKNVGGQVGEIIRQDKNSLGIIVKDGILQLKEVQLAGKKRMTIEEFIKGFSIGKYKLVI